MNSQTRSETDAVTDTSRDAENVVDSEKSKDEFKLTVRKLDMPVRPRGVLAE